jgi:transcriptional regulator with XRE-family HTH domain
MATRERPGDRGAADAIRTAQELGREIRAVRRRTGLSLRAAAIRAGMSASQLARLERAKVGSPTVEQVCRAARAVGLRASVRLYPDGPPVHDRASLAVIARFERMLGAPLRLAREVGLPIAGDLRAWDGRIVGGRGPASVECEGKLEDIQAVSRRIALKQRDDPEAGVVILLVNRTERNRRVVADHREALRAQFPLDGAAILRDLRAGRIPPASGILML